MTLLEIATILAARDGKPEPTNGEDFAAYNIPMFAGCQYCGETLAVYNAHPQHNGYVSCKQCSRAPFVDMEEWEARQELEASAHDSTQEEAHDDDNYVHLR
jgi:hypothetical protein